MSEWQRRSAGLPEGMPRVTDAAARAVARAADWGTAEQVKLALHTAVRLGQARSVERRGPACEVPAQADAAALARAIDSTERFAEAVLRAAFATGCLQPPG